MNLKRPSTVATATVAAAGFGSVAYACDERNVSDERQVPMVEMPDSRRPDPAASDSPHDADLRAPRANRRAGG